MTANDAKTPEISIAVPTDAVMPHEPSRERAVRRLWRAEAIYALSLVGFSVLALLAHFVTYFDWDLRVERAIQSLPVPGLFGLMRAVSIFGNGWIPWALTIITVAIFYAYKKRSEAVGLLLSAAGGSLLNIMVKVLVGRPRPTDELVAVYRDLRTESFPSGHVTFYVCYFGFLFFAAFALLPRGSWARRTALFLTALPVALVGLSRVYLGAHWPSDTLGAYLLSGLWLALSLHFYRRWKQRATFHPKLQKPDAAPQG